MRSRNGLSIWIEDAPAERAVVRRCSLKGDQHSGNDREHNDAYRLTTTMVTSAVELDAISTPRVVTSVLP